MSAPKTKEEIQARVRKSLDRYERKPHWLAKRASRTTNDFIASMVRRELKEMKKTA